MPREANVNARQLDVLCTFFEENPEVIKGYKKTQNRIDAVQLKWRKITPHLNSLGNPRDHKSWSKYLCNIKCKMKLKGIKYQQNSDGTGPLIFNPSDFNQVELRMMQVLDNSPKETEDYKLQEMDTSDFEDEDIPREIKVKNPKSTKSSKRKHRDDTYSAPEVKEKDKPISNKTHIKLLDSNNPLLTDTKMKYNLMLGDEFDTFGTNVAQQLRTLPLDIALETQEMLLSVLHKQRLKVLK